MVEDYSYNAPTPQSNARIKNIYRVLKKDAPVKDYSKGFYLFRKIEQGYDQTVELVDGVRLGYNKLRYGTYEAQVASLFSYANGELNKIQKENEKLKYQGIESLGKHIKQYNRVRNKNLLEPTTFNSKGEINPNSEFIKEFNFLFNAPEERYLNNEIKGNQTVKNAKGDGNPAEIYKNLLILQQSRAKKLSELEQLSLGNKKDDEEIKKRFAEKKYTELSKQELEELKKKAPMELLKKDLAALDESIENAEAEMFKAKYGQLIALQTKEIEKSKNEFERENIKKLKERLEEKISEYRSKYERFKKAEEINQKKLEGLDSKDEKYQQFEGYREQMEESRDYYKNASDGYQKFYDKIFGEYEKELENKKQEFKESKTRFNKEEIKLEEKIKKLHENSEVLIKKELEGASKKFGDELEGDPNKPRGRFETLLGRTKFFNHAITAIDDQNTKRIENFKKLQEELANDGSVKTSEVKKRCFGEMEQNLKEITATKRVIKDFNKNLENLSKGPTRRAIEDFKFSEIGKSVTNIQNARKKDPAEHKEEAMNKALASAFFAVYPEWKTMQNGKDMLYETAKERNVRFFDPSLGKEVQLTHANSKFGLGATRLHKFKIELMEERLGGTERPVGNNTNDLTPVRQSQKSLNNQNDLLPRSASTTKRLSAAIEPFSGNKTPSDTSIPKDKKQVHVTQNPKGPSLGGRG